MKKHATETETPEVRPAADGATTSPEPPAPPSDPPAPAADAKRTAEEIATARGWLPPFVDGPGGRKVKNPDWWRYAAAFGHKPLGQEVTEKEFDAAVEAAINTNHG